MFDSYRRVLATPGALLFSLTGLVARLPISMIGLGIVLLVAGTTGSYGVAGSVSATFLVANAVVSIFLGRLVDRAGQGRVLTAAVLVCTTGLLVLVTAVRLDWSLAVAYVAAAVAGLSSPPVGACVRARWSHVLDRPAQVQTAFAFEAVVDEVVFIVGPILVTLLATTVDPAAGLVTAAVAGLVGTLAFAAQRRTAPPARVASGVAGPRDPMPWAMIVPLTVVTLMLGGFFGSAEVATVAFTDERGGPQYAGVLLGLWALGSLVAGLATGAITWQVGPGVRVRWGAVVLTLVMAQMVLIGTIWLMGAALFVAGFAIAPTLIATLSLVEQRTPASRLTEGMAFVHTGIVAGVAPGATLAGVVIDSRGASPAYLVAVGCGLLAALTSLALPAPDRPGRR